MSNTIHPTAIVHKDAVLGTGNTIGAFCIVEAHTVMGNNNTFNAHSIIKEYTTMGDNNRVHSFIALGDIPQDLKFAGERTELHIGNNNVFREHCSIHRGTEQDKGRTTIGDNNLFMTNTHIAHDCTVEDNVVLSSGVGVAGHVHLESYCILGGGAGIHQFTRIGQYSFVAAMSAIARDVPPFMIASDRRSVATIQGVNLVGLRRAGISRETIFALKESANMLWKNDGENREDVLDKIDALYGSIAEVQIFLAFIRGTKRGILGIATDED